MTKFLLTLTACAAVCGVFAQTPPGRDTICSHAERARRLVGRMTLEEKVSQMQNSAPAIPRLGIERYDWWSEALHGIARAGLATVFPQTIGMAASFDRPLVERVFTAVSDEARAKHREFVRSGSRKRYQGLTVWTPNINIFRDPRWGRGQETYGEDPYLTAQLGLAVVRGLQGEPKGGFDKLHACAKHFAVHSGPEWNRHSFDAKNIAPRDLAETYLPAFQALVQEGGVKEVMGAYNRFEGEPCNGNPQLLEELLRKQWGFDGIVVSDCGAIRDFYGKGRHETHADAATASAAAVKAGCDLECGGSYASLVEAVARGLITEQEIDRSVERLMKARFELGLFEEQDPFDIPYSKVDCAEHRALAKLMAIETFVLLQNRGGLLPLSPEQKIALVGPNADNAVMQWGNYNGTPYATSTLLDGLRIYFPGDRLVYEPLCGHTDETTYRSLFDCCSTEEGAGFTARYWNNRAFEGKVAATDRLERPFRFSAAGNTVFAPGVTLKDFTARYTTRFRPTHTGRAACRLMTNGAVRILLDGKTVAERENVKNPATVCDFAFEAGRSYELVVEFTQVRDDPSLSFDLAEEQPQDLEAFLRRIEDVDVVVFAGGISPQLEGEEMAVSAEGFRGGDRTDIELPAVQRRTIEALHKAGKRIVLVNFSGSAVGLEPEATHCDAILQAWYPGQAGGEALADVLTGVAAPSGKLPVTFYRHTEQLPDFEDYRMQGRTYRYFKGDALFPFGHGLSYTDFFYGYLRSDRKKLYRGGTLSLAIPVGNIGVCTGEEVVQLYLQREDDPEGPIQTLRDFRRVRLAPGATEMLLFQLEYDDFAWYDPDTQQMTARPGLYVIRVGGTSDREHHRTLAIELK